MKELTVEATTSNVERVTDFVDEQLEQIDCPMPMMVKINVAIDEVFSNIVNYAYNPESGNATITVDVSKERPGVIISFIDSGREFNPLESTEPDLSVPVDERPIGGLGIFMVRKMMDEVSYERIDNTNVLRITKFF